ncbi:MAG: hypothetical protein K0S43_1500 [Cellulosimicrobium sp.]|jgi:hypothetical protein|nr:hypothetical protein [Cellulosimicrobium sp.]
MTEPTSRRGWISAAEFHRAPGVSDWRVTGSGPQAVFAATSLSHAAALVPPVVEAAERAGVRPDLDVRPWEAPALHENMSSSRTSLSDPIRCNVRASRACPYSPARVASTSSRDRNTASAPEDLFTRTSSPIANQMRRRQ